MATVLPQRGAVRSPLEQARLHFVLRFSVGTTAAFVLCEWMGWQPAALAPVLTAVLLTNLPTAPPLKVGIGLILIMAVWAWLAFFMTIFLAHAPQVLFGLVALIVFLAFAGLANAKGQLPLTILLVCFAIIPVVTPALPTQHADIFAKAFVRAMLLAVIFTWMTFAIWPLPSPKPRDPPAPALGSPIAAAICGSVIVLPVMLVYMLYSITNAIPVLLTTVLLVSQMAVERGAASARAKMLGNFLGGIIAVLAFYLLNIAPSLATLALILFVIAVGFSNLIVDGGIRGGNALLSYNMAVVIFGLALLKGADNAGVWITRLLQFGIACAFAVGMMQVLWPRMLARSRGRA